VGCDLHHLIATLRGRGWERSRQKSKAYFGKAQASPRCSVRAPQLCLALERISFPSARPTGIGENRVLALTPNMWVVIIRLQIAIGRKFQVVRG
jgi:hypothetical protein